MAQYYSNTCVTIVPIHADMAHSGMGMGQNVPFYRTFSSPWNAEAGSNVMLSGKSVGDQDAISKSLWNQRGWTYQEGLNSSRVLFVFNSNMLLQCREGSWSTRRGWEEFRYRGNSVRKPAWRFLTTGEIARFKTGDHRRNTAFSQDWRNFVGRYTKRRLTSPKDKWVAFSSIAEAFTEASSLEIIAGLLENSLIQEIVSWRAPKPQSQKPALAHATSVGD